jgi:hypothetical protein
MAAKSISLDDDGLEAEATGLKVDIGDAAELDEAIETEGMRPEGETFRLDDVLCPSCPNAETDCACEALALRLPNTDDWPCAAPKTCVVVAPVAGAAAPKEPKTEAALPLLLLNVLKALPVCCCSLNVLGVPNPAVGPVVCEDGPPKPDSALPPAAFPNAVGCPANAEKPPPVPPLGFELGGAAPAPNADGPEPANALNAPVAGLINDGVPLAPANGLGCPNDGCPNADVVACWPPEGCPAVGCANTDAEVWPNAVWPKLEEG